MSALGSFCSFEEGEGSIADRLSFHSQALQHRKFRIWSDENCDLLYLCNHAVCFALPSLLVHPRSSSLLEPPPDVFG